MKTSSTLLILLFAICAEVQAQKIYFSDTSNKWIVWENDATPPYAGDNIYANRDAVTQNGHTWTLLKKVVSFIWSQLYIDSALVRDDTIANKVYAIIYPDTTEVVLYDYNLQIGDTFRMTNPSNSYEHVVTQVDSTLINGSIK